MIGDAVLYLGDCREILPTLGKVDAVVTDPPYGIGRDKGFGSGGAGKNGAPRKHVKKYAGGWDDERPEMARILENANWSIVWGGQFFAASLPVGGKWLWWDKLQTMPSFGDGEMAWTNLPGNAIKKMALSINGVIARGETGLHPTQKPVELMQWCLENLPDDAVIICDPFMGSGSVGVAAVKMGKTFIGIEREPQYFEIACKRIDAATKEPDMFIAPPSSKPVQEPLI